MIKQILFLGVSLFSPVPAARSGINDHYGHADIVFHKKDYNYDAFVLLYGNLQKHLEFEWSYH